MKSPICLLSNDWHVSKTNIDEFNKNWDEMVAVCKERGITDVVVGGDVFTSRASQVLAVLMAVRNAFERAKAAGLFIVIAEGNHDKVDQRLFEGYNHIWKGIEYIELVDEHTAIVYEDAEVGILVMSYFPEEEFEEHLDNAVEKTLKQFPDMKKSDFILYIHEGVHGALGDFDAPGEIDQEVLEGFHKVLCGHYHNRTRIKKTNIEYIGSSRQHNFGEDEEKGYTVVYDDGTTEFIKNKVNTRYKTIELTAKEAADYQLEKDPLYVYRAKVECSEKESKKIDRQKLLEQGFLKVEIVVKEAADKTVVHSSINKKYDKKGIVAEYKNYCNEKAIDSNLGVDYLKG